MFILLLVVSLVIFLWRLPAMISFVKQKFSVHLRKPGEGLWGFLCKLALKGNNATEEIAFRKLNAKPHHNVLELGFGYGHGLSYALSHGFREGTGTLYGVDYSKKVCDHVQEVFEDDVKNGKLVIYNGDVAALPFQDSQMDRVYHTNCYYFWSDHLAVCKEISRVMKPGGLMVTGIQHDKVKAAATNGLIPKAGSDLEAYMKCLEDAGFANVRKELVGGTDVSVVYAKRL